MGVQMSEKTSVETADGSTEEAPEVVDLNQEPEPQKEAEPQAEEAGSTEQVEEPGSKDSGDNYSERVQKRISKITGDKLAAEHRAKMAEAEVKKLKEMAGAKPSVPDVSQYQDEYGDLDANAYNQAMAQYHENIIVWHDSQKTETQAEEQAIANQQAKWQQFQVAAEPARAKYSDFDEVIQRPVFGDELSNVLIDNQMVDVAYYLGNNEAEAYRIRNLPPIQMAAELGKLEGQLLSMPAQSSKAPEPITPVSDEKGVSLNEPTISDDDWLKKAERERLQKIKEKSGLV